MSVARNASVRTGSVRTLSSRPDSSRTRSSGIRSSRTGRSRTVLCLSALLGPLGCTTLGAPVEDETSPGTTSAPTNEPAPDSSEPSDSSEPLNSDTTSDTEDDPSSNTDPPVATDFLSYEAEDMETNGEVLGPTRQFGQVAAEASRRQAVRLGQTGDYVQFVTQEPTNSLVVRYSIPDGGHDFWTTLTVEIDGEVRTQLDLTSRYSWTYGDEQQFNLPEQEDPNQGHPHHFFDEVRALIGDVPTGSTITLKKTAGDGASHYDIDLVETEQVPPPLPQPEGSLSVSDCGATPDDGSDDSAAIQECLEQAADENRVLFIPAGTFHSLSSGFSVQGVTIAGAGMWHSTIQGFYARFDCWEPTCHYRDFSVFGDTVLRDDASPETAFSGNGSSGASLERIWVEHSKVGYWTGAETDGLVIRDSRFRNLHADAVNLFGGTSNSLIEGCHARNTGDDAFAAWSLSEHAANTGNVFRDNYVQVPWKANCFGIYGGADTLLEDNVCSDVVQYPGILVARQFNSHAFTGDNRIVRTRLIRAGGFTYGSPHGALKFHAAQGPVQHWTVSDVEILGPTYSAIHIEGDDFVSHVLLDGVTVENPGTAVFRLEDDAHGALDAVGVQASGAGTGILDESGGAFSILRGDGNSGW